MDTFIQVTECAELGSISPHNKLKAISFETMPCNPNKRLWISYKL